MSPHESCQRLLPWYANGTLNERDMSACTKHIADCEHCRAELELTIGQMQALSSAPSTAPAPGDPGLLIVKAKRRNRHRQNVPANTKSGMLRRFAPIAAAALLVLGAFLIDRVEPSPGVYRAMTDRVAEDGFFLQVAFRETASEAEIRGFVLASGGVLDGNPTPAGIYRLRFDHPVQSELLEQFREAPMVTWANVEL